MPNLKTQVVRAPAASIVKSPSDPLLYSKKKDFDFKGALAQYNQKVSFSVSVSLSYWGS